MKYMNLWLHMDIHVLRHPCAYMYHADMADITDDLKKQGVTQIDVLTGEDMKKVLL
jgi:hypothetical protein